MLRFLVSAAISIALIFLASCFGLGTTFAASPDNTTEKTIPQGQDPPGADEEEQTTQPPAERQGPLRSGMRTFTRKPQTQRRAITRR
jgi:hypothetical protein